MKKNEYAAIILAAGFSRRMQDFKPLLKIGGQTVTDRVISSFLAHEVEVLLVIGWRGEELLAGIDHRDVRSVENPDYETGMFSSVQAGVRHLALHHRAFFIMPVDIPLVRPETIGILLEHASQAQDKILYPVFASRRGHPPLIPAVLIGDILSRPVSGNLREVLSAHQELAAELAVADRYIREDMDTREDYTRLLEGFQKYHIPTAEECEALQKMSGTRENIRRHCEQVARVAVAISGKLIESGSQISIAEVRGAALLHDIAKGRPAHHIAGAQLVRKHGFPTTGDIVETHEISEDGTAPETLEAKVVFLADKLVLNEKIVPLEGRFYAARRKYGTHRETPENIDMREACAASIKKEVENLLGRKLTANYVAGIM